MKTSFTLILSFVILNIANTTAQVTIGKLAAPKATLDVVAAKTDGTTAEGIIAPRLTLAELILANANYTEEQRATIVYITDLTGATPSGSTAAITAPGYYYFDGAKWQSFRGEIGDIPVDAWTVFGNAGTNPATNFIGTTDNQPLIFRFHNEFAGSLGAGAQNVSFGYHAFNPLTYSAGWGNIAIGELSLGIDSSGYRNVAIGGYALGKNKKGFANVAVGETTSYGDADNVSYTVAIGQGALCNNQMSGNTGVGFAAAGSNKTGVELTGVGYNALALNTGSYNSAFGFNALINNTTGFNNTAIGAESLVNNTEASANTAVGFKSLNSNTIGSNNTALGEVALRYNQTGNYNVGLGAGALGNNIIGHDNTAVGTSALYHTTGGDNTAVGEEALAGNFEGVNNTAVGSRALWSTSNADPSGNGALAFGHGSNNTALGYEALPDITSGSSNVGIGFHALMSDSTGETTWLLA